MKTKILLSMIMITVAFTSCDTGTVTPPDPVITETITELDAQATITMGQFGPIYSGDYTKFSFAEGGIVDGDNWDVAFRSTHIIVNGGMVSDTSQPNRTGNAAVYITVGEMGDIISVDSSLLMQDTETSSAIIDDLGVSPNGGPGVWCTYSNQIITPNAGAILVFRTHDNKYAKIEILNFYDQAMSNIYGGFYTFNYVYQPNENTLNF
tara:strand:+ start:200 stop:823 length:624 start_codon:yes stop_codon:yes gene_type:complete